MDQLQIIVAGKRIKNKCLVIIPNLFWLVQGTRGWGVAKPAQEAAALLAGHPLDLCCCPLDLG